VGLKNQIDMKVSLYLRNRVNAKGLSPVYFKVSNGRGDQAKTPTQLTVNKRYWKGGQVSTKHSNADLLNTELRNLRNKGEEAELKWTTGQFSNTREVIAYLQGKQDNHSLDTFLHTTLKADIKQGDYDNKRWGLSAFKRVLNHKGDLMFSDITPNYLAKYRKLGQAIVRRKELKPESLTSYGQYTVGILTEAYRRGVITEKPNLDTKYYFNFGKSNTEVPSHTWQELLNAINNADTIQKWQSCALWLLQFGLRGINNADVSRISDRLLVELVDIRGKERLVSVENKDLMREVYLDYGRSKNSQPMIIQLFPPVLTLLKYLKNTAVYTYIDKKTPDGKRIIRGMEDRTNVFDYEKTTNEKFHSRLWAARQDKFKLMSDDKIQFSNARNSFYQVGEGLGMSHNDIEKLIGHSVGVSTKSYSNLSKPNTIRRLSKQHRDILEEFRYPHLINRLVKKLYEICANEKVPNWILASAIVGKNTMLTIDIDEYGNVKENTPKTVKIDPKYLKYFTNTKEIEVDSLDNDNDILQRIYSRLAKEVKSDLKVVHQVDTNNSSVKVS
jgi:hypothetical protein